MDRDFLVHGNHHRSQYPLVQPIPLEHRAVVEQEAPLGVLRNLISGVGVVKDDLREYVVRPAADAAVDVVAYPWRRWPDKLDAHHIGKGSHPSRDRVHITSYVSGVGACPLT